MIYVHIYYIWIGYGPCHARCGPDMVQLSMLAGEIRTLENNDSVVRTETGIHILNALEQRERTCPVIH